MSTARKAEAVPQRTSIRDRARSSRAAAQRLRKPSAQAAALPPACAVSRIGQSLHEAFDEYLALDERQAVERSSSRLVLMSQNSGLRGELQEAIS